MLTKKQTDGRNLRTGARLGKKTTFRNDDVRHGPIIEEKHAPGPLKKWIREAGEEKGRSGRTGKRGAPIRPAPSRNKKRFPNRNRIA